MSPFEAMLAIWVLGAAFVYLTKPDGASRTAIYLMLPLWPAFFAIVGIATLAGWIFGLTKPTKTKDDK